MNWVVIRQRSQPETLDRSYSMRSHVHILRAHRIVENDWVYGIRSTTRVVLPCDSCDADRYVRSHQFGMLHRINKQPQVLLQRAFVHTLLSHMMHGTAWWPAYGIWYMAYFNYPILESKYSRGYKRGE